MQTEKIETEGLSNTENIIDDIEYVNLLKIDKKRLKAKEFINVLTDMILSYSHSLD